MILVSIWSAAVVVASGASNARPLLRGAVTPDKLEGDSPTTNERQEQASSSSPRKLSGTSKVDPVSDCISSLGKCPPTGASAASSTSAVVGHGAPSANANGGAIGGGSVRGVDRTDMELEVVEGLDTGKPQVQRGPPHPKPVNNPALGSGAVTFDEDEGIERADEVPAEDVTPTQGGQLINPGGFQIDWDTLVFVDHNGGNR